MGYSTYFYGEYTIDRPLDAETAALIDGIHETRRMKRDLGMIARQEGITTAEAYRLYGVDGEFYMRFREDAGQRRTEDIFDYNNPPDTQPGLWCGWELSENNDSLIWDEGEKFYCADSWIVYLIERILKPRGYVVNGRMEAHGEMRDDTWIITVVNNNVYVTDLILQEDLLNRRQILLTHNEEGFRYINRTVNEGDLIDTYNHQQYP